MARQKLDSMTWLSRYDAAIRKALRGCRTKVPLRNLHYAPGHMYMGRGLTPVAAARKYLGETRYGKQVCVRMPR